MNELLRWGILSTANHADSAYVPAIQASRNGCVAAVASRSLEKASNFAQKHHIPKVHGSYEALLTDPEIDLIYNPLPNGMHAEWSIRAAEAGKPVLCEKPLCANGREAEQMAEAVRKTGVPIAEAYMYRLHPLNCQARDLLRDGRIGDVRNVHAQFFAGGDDPDNIRFSQALAGGSMRDLGGYCTSLMRFLLGEEPEEVKAVSQEHPNGGIDYRLSGVLRFPEGRTASFDCGFGVPFTCSYTVIGTEGRLAVPTGAMVASKTKEQPIHLWTADGRFEEIMTPVANHYQLMAEHFADVVKGTATLLYPIEDAVANMRVMDRVLEAAGYP